MMADWPTLLACQSACCTSPNLEAAGPLDHSAGSSGTSMTRPTDGRVQYRHALLRFVTSSPTASSSCGPPRRRSRRSRAPGGAAYNAVTEYLDHVVPVRGARTASDPSAARALRNITASGSSPSLQSPSIPDAANPVTGHAGHRGRPAPQPPGVGRALFFFRYPSARLLDRHGPPPRRHPLAKPSDPGRCGPP